MISDWKTVPASEFCASVRDGTHDSPKPVEHGEFLVTSRHIVGRHLDLENAYRISKDDFDAINRRSKVDQWDVLISMIGTVGEPCLVKKEPNFAIKNIGLFKSKGETQGRWLYYYLQSRDAQDLIRRQSRGSTQQYIPLGALRGFPVPVPGDPKEMNSIVDVLGALDDKIEQNQRTARVMERLTRAIFRAWFVDFAPVKAKAEGAAVFPSMPKAVFDTLPTRIVDSEIGPVPEGWEPGTLGSVLKESTRKNLDERITLVLSAVSTGELVASDDHFNKRVYSKSLSNYRVVSPGAIAFNPSRINIGSVGVNHRDVDGVVSPVYVVCSAPREYEWFFEFYLRLSGVRKKFETLSSGSVRQSLRAVDFLSIELAVPNRELVLAFNQEFMNCKRLLDALDVESQKLAELRDYLLPKLLSGSVRVEVANG